MCLQWQSSHCSSSIKSYCLLCKLSIIFFLSVLFSLVFSISYGRPVIFKKNEYSLPLFFVMLVCGALFFYTKDYKLQRRFIFIGFFLLLFTASFILFFFFFGMSATDKESIIVIKKENRGIKYNKSTWLCYY